MTARAKPKHIDAHRAGGKVYYYHRKTRERLPDDSVKRAERAHAINEALGLNRKRVTPSMVERLKRENADQQRTIEDLKKIIRDQRQRMSDADAEGALWRPDAYWHWEPPQPAPQRLRGVYRLLREGKTVYIGQSVNILSRITEHAATKSFDAFSYALVDGSREALNDIESALIVLERPPGNRTHSTVHKWTREKAQAVLDKYRRRARDSR